MGTRYTLHEEPNKGVALALDEHSNKFDFVAEITFSSNGRQSFASFEIPNLTVMELARIGRRLNQTLSYWANDAEKSAIKKLLQDAIDDL